MKTDAQVISDLARTVNWLERVNKSMFNHFNVKVVLYIIENRYSEVESRIYKQKRRSFPLESAFFNAFPDMYKNMIEYLKFKLINNKSEVKLALSFKFYDKVSAAKKRLRIDKMLKENKNERWAYNSAIQKQESVLFDDTDN